MHELGIMTGVMEAVEKSAVQAGATKVLKVTLSIGEMTEAIEDSLRFAFGATARSISRRTTPLRDAWSPCSPTAISRPA